MPGMDTPLIPITFVWTDWRVGQITQAELAETRAQLVAEGDDPNMAPDLVEGEVAIERTWYHTPRPGEHVTLTRISPPTTDIAVGGEPTIETYSGIVHQVFWTDDGLRVVFAE